MKSDPIYVLSLPVGTPPERTKELADELTRAITAGQLVVAVAGGSITVIPRPGANDA